MGRRASTLPKRQRAGRSTRRTSVEKRESQVWCVQLAFWFWVLGFGVWSESESEDGKCVVEGRREDIQSMGRRASTLPKRQRAGRSTRRTSVEKRESQVRCVQLAFWFWVWGFGLWSESESESGSAASPVDLST